MRKRTNFSQSDITSVVNKFVKTAQVLNTKGSYFGRGLSFHTTEITFDVTGMTSKQKGQLHMKLWKAGWKFDFHTDDTRLTVGLWDHEFHHTM